MAEARANIGRLTDPLPDSEIDIRVQSIFENGWAILLAYKTARADARRLDDVVGAMSWQKVYYQDAKGNTVCAIEIWDKTKKAWVRKEDVGEENNQGCKGTYSDAFKRAGFAWGIGRELYDLPVLFVKLNDDEFQANPRAANKFMATNKLRVTQWSFERVISDSSTSVIMKDEKGGVRFKEDMQTAEEKTLKSHMNTNVHDMYINNVDTCYEHDDLMELWKEMDESYVIPADIKKLFTFRKDAIESGEVLRYEDKNGV